MERNNNDSAQNEDEKKYEILKAYCNSIGFQIKPEYDSVEGAKMISDFLENELFTKGLLKRKDQTSAQQPNSDQSAGGAQDQSTQK